MIHSLQRDYSSTITAPTTAITATASMNDGDSIHVLVDQSSSMGAMNDATYAGARELIDSVSPETLVTFSTFSDAVRIGDRCRRDEALAALATRAAAGRTALYDAIIAAIRTEEQSPQTRTTIVVVTDGVDNSSHASNEQARMAIDAAHVRGWRMQFIGCNQDAVIAAAQLGIPVGRALTFGNNASDVRAAFRAVSESNNRIRAGGEGEFLTVERIASSRAGAMARMET